MSPKGDPARNSRSRSALSCLSWIQRQTWASSVGGATRLRLRVHSRSAMMAVARMELRMIGSIIQPPALTISNTRPLPLPQNAATLARTPESLFKGSRARDKQGDKT